MKMLIATMLLTLSFGAFAQNEFELNYECFEQGRPTLTVDLVITVKHDLSKAETLLPQSAYVTYNQSSRSGGKFSAVGADANGEYFVAVTNTNHKVKIYADTFVAKITLDGRPSQKGIVYSCDLLPAMKRQ